MEITQHKQDFDYSFDNLARLMEKLVDKLGVKSYSLYLMDDGAPIGFRMASANPQRIDSLIIQNGNAYEEGLRVSLQTRPGKCGDSFT